MGKINHCRDKQHEFEQAHPDITVFTSVQISEQIIYSITSAMKN